MNQPRMRADGANEDNIISFSFVDATNLAKPTDGHRHNLAITFKDKDHITQAWTFRQNGEENTMKFELARKVMTSKTEE
ncbi:hypothetical protein A2V82_13520 [candidate division KSB1 bacterium RBG_16_48_16]|nr:MAG: hypothetical protein A2V82_13520 [candidate division KSB1 bacterium RBG_16_48_16]